MFPTAADVVTYLNERATKTLGYRLEDVLGASVFDYIHPDDLAYMAWSWEARQSDHSHLAPAE